MPEAMVETGRHYLELDDGKRCKVSLLTTGDDEEQQEALEVVDFEVSCGLSCISASSNGDRWMNLNTPPPPP